MLWLELSFLLCLVGLFCLPLSLILYSYPLYRSSDLAKWLWFMTSLHETALHDIDSSDLLNIYIYIYIENLVYNNLYFHLLLLFYLLLILHTFRICTFSLFCFLFSIYTFSFFLISLWFRRFLYDDTFGRARTLLPNFSFLLAYTKSLFNV